LAAYAGAGIAGSNSMKTGFQALKIALAAFIVPYIFAINPELIMVEEIVGTTVVFMPFIQALPVILSAVIGILCLAAAVESYLIRKTNIIERVLLAGAALMLLNPGYLSDAFGLAVLVGTYLIQRMQNKKENLA